MSRLIESEPHLESPPPRTPGPDERLLDVARELPAFLIELRHSERGEFRFGFIGEGIRAVLPIQADEATADPARLLSMIHPEDLDRLRAAMTCAARERTPLHDEFRVCPAPDRAVWLAIHAHCTLQADGAQLWQGWLADVTERRLAQAALADSELRHRKLFDANPIPMWVHDRLTLHFITVNDAAVARYGWSREEFLSMTLVDLRHPGPDGSDPGDAPSQDGGVRPATAHHRLRDGSLIEVELSSQPLTWNGRPARMVMALDVTARRRAEAEIQRLAYYDTLTRLPNRRLLTDRLRQSVAAGVRGGRHGAVLCIDLDDFKRVNDTRGHPAGDEVLLQAAARIRASVRTEDTVARLGGDEFVVVLERLDGDARQAAAQADETAQRLMSTLATPFEITDMRFHSSASIGVAMFGGAGISDEDVLMHADSAMYRAKAAGRGTVRFYDPAMQVALQTRAALETDLRRALSEGQLRLAYQAQVEASGRIVGAEVLLRWQHPVRGPIPPMDFIPMAEETGLIVPIGQWVLETACMQLAGWARKPQTRALRLSVNVSARQFRQPDFVQRVERALSDSGADPARLRLELTESLLLDNINDCIAKMQSLQAMGVGFSLDDFGTGYSSLSYLKRLPLEELKIDRSFIRDIATDPSDAVIVQTIIGMARNLGLTVIAEGVETAEQLAFLDRHGCGAYQGWYFGRPVPLPDFEASLLPAAPRDEALRPAAVPAGPSPEA
ncbi:MAG: EAL domain-containing protein [Burkholderiales bacterium]|nr:EAL domain-containing protein [Burkholderiales bacterium]